MASLKKVTFLPYFWDENARTKDYYFRPFELLTTLGRRSKL
jgi:hypothetical protein